jgi:hypothetical protein
MLHWHLERGTRPASAPDSKGAPWSNKEFANSVGKAKNAAQAPSERTIRNWRHDETLPEPPDFNAVLLALFGGKSDYADWRREFTDKYHKARTLRDAGADGLLADLPLTTAAPVVSVPTPPLRCLGRDDDLAAVLQALTAEGDRIAVLILGGPGMGKTTLTRQAATDSALIERFGNRRWFVELETSTDAKLSETAIVKAVGLDPATAKFDHAVALVAQARGLFVLDNLETPWEAARGEVEKLLAQLHALPNLALLASVRGNEPPGGLRWTRQRTMHPLEWPHDRDLFLDIAQDINADDPDLEPLLRQLGGVPLAVELVAMQAAPHDTVVALHEEWQRVGVALARRRGVEPSRLTSLEISLELSFNAQRLGEAGRRLLSILGQLPAGIGADDLKTLFAEAAFDARQGLLSCGLAFEHDGRLDLLPPVRDHARRLHPPAEPDAALWRNHFLQLAEVHGDRIGETEGAGSVGRLAAELPNLDAAQGVAIAVGDLAAALSASRGISTVMQFTGLGSPTTLRDLATACRETGSTLGETNCIQSLGDIALERSDHEAARNAYEQALPLFRQVGSILGEANCIQSLGTITLERSDHEAARSRYLDALSLYERISEPYSIGHTRLRLAMISDGEERDRHLTAARAAWTSIDRADLVELLEPADRTPTKDKGSRRRTRKR